MIISIRKIGAFLRFTLAFALLTLMFYVLLDWAGSWMIPPDPYRVPVGHAIKAFNPNELPSHSFSPGDRLKLYYWVGE